ncbi:hypothetical protein ACIF83_35890 [Streptomyces sp. NPDC085866]|uniref:hypothetical protein n=1 Tax=Streptomyces sp. NPDC085866 TaxID=3365736 RepID=UPI0037D86B2E
MGITGDVGPAVSRPAQCLAGAVTVRWEPRIRAAVRLQAETGTGTTIETRARFGFTAAPRQYRR